MKRQEDTTEKTVHALLSGSHPAIKKFAGKHVFVIEKDVVPLRAGQLGLADFKKLKEKYGKAPTLVFVPQPNITFILHLK